MSKKLACAAIVALIASSQPHAGADEMESLQAVAVRIAPKDRSTSKPIVVALHGQCDDAADFCPLWGDVVGDRAFVVCPRGNVACVGGGATWIGARRTDSVFLGMAATALDHPGEVDLRRATLVGFSLGAPVALDLVTHRLGGWRGLVLVSSVTIDPSAASLKTAGIERVVLAAGDLDLSRAHMQKVTKHLVLQGIDARFVSLGKVAHVLPSDLSSRIGDALDWVQGIDAP